MDCLTIYRTANESWKYALRDMEKTISTKNPTRELVVEMDELERGAGEDFQIMQKMYYEMTAGKRDQYTSYDLHKKRHEEIARKYLEWKSRLVLEPEASKSSKKHWPFHLHHDKGGQA
jgi:uncharacterized protein with ATP-grasp and redox domains